MEENTRQEEVNKELRLRARAELCPDRRLTGRISRKTWRRTPGRRRGPSELRLEDSFTVSNEVHP